MTLPNGLTSSLFTRADSTEGRGGENKSIGNVSPGVGVSAAEGAVLYFFSVGTSCRGNVN